MDTRVKKGAFLSDKKGMVLFLQRNLKETSNSTNLKNNRIGDRKLSAFESS
jgi:hypothetical protein